MPQQFKQFNIYNGVLPRGYMTKKLLYARDTS